MDQHKNLTLGIFQQSRQAMAIYDTADLRIAFVNNAMLKIWGRDEDIVGKCFGDVFPEFTEQGFTDILKNVWNKRETYEAVEYPADVTINNITEKKYFDFIYQPIIDEGGETYSILHTATDVSLQRLALQKIEEQDDIMRFNDELEGLARTLSHDLKNPLSIAKMATQYLQTKGEFTESEKHKWTTIILDALASINHIIGHNIQLNQTRLSKYHNECIPLEKTIRRICAESKTLYKSTACVFKIGALESLYGDERVFYQVFFNIIGNAVKYSSKQKDPVVYINSSRKQGYVLYTIQDNGIGVPAEELSNMFQQFHRAPNTEGYPGTGVGLCVVEKIMKRLKGEIKLSSSPDKGTTVELLFPENVDCYP